MKTRTKRLGLVGLVAIVTVGAEYARKAFTWDNFGVVESGQIYRSGQLKPIQMKEAIRRHGLRSVLRLNSDRTGDAASEEQVVREQGVKYYSAVWPGNGVVDEARLNWAYEIISDPANQPVLVHCARGTSRTGAVVAYYRIRHSSWSRERIRDEMVSYRHRPDSNTELETMVDQLWRTSVQTASRHEAVDDVPQRLLK
jgi:protein tyrosine/serine phosphatase